MKNRFVRSLWVGVRRRWWDGVRYGFGAVGAAWTLTEVATRAIPGLNKYVDSHGTGFLGVMGLFLIGVFIAHVYEPLIVNFKIPTTDTVIFLKYGDLLSEEADLLIGVNEYFDGELGLPVAPMSVHGQFITKFFKGSGPEFRRAVDIALAATGVAPAQNARAAEPRGRYPIGTTAVLRNGVHKAFLMAMARTDAVTFKASSDVATLWNALQIGLRAVHDQGNGEPVAMPLFGNAQAGINLKPQHLLRLLTLAIVDFGRSRGSALPKNVTVVLHDRCFEELDIREIAQDWKKS